MLSFCAISRCPQDDAHFEPISVFKFNPKWIFSRDHERLNYRKMCEFESKLTMLHGCGGDGKEEL